MPTFSTRRRFLVLSPLLSIFLFTLAACTDVTGVTVTGKVTFNNEPLTSATVFFVYSDGQERACNTGNDGSYEMKNVPVGTAKIKVVTFAPIPPGLAPKDGPVPAAVNIPAKYKKENASGLTLDVKQGQNHFDILLTR